MPFFSFPLTIEKCKYFTEGDDVVLNQNDKKNIIVVILVVILILGIFLVTNGLQKVKELEKEKYLLPEEPTITEPEKEENPGQSEDSSNSYFLPVQNKQEEKHSEKSETTIVEKNNPKVTIASTYYCVSLHDSFTFPELISLEDSNDHLSVTITYMFQALDSIDFIPVMEFSTEKLGTYKITYYVENEEHNITVLEFYVEILDNVSPIIEGIVERETADGFIEYIPVENGSFLHETVTFSFRDDDEIRYLEYYNASIDNTIEGSQLEEFAMPTIIPIEVGSILELTEEGEYHIRAYDRSGNVTEFVVTLDFTNPEIEVNYQQVGENLTLVTMTSNEILLDVSGWETTDHQTFQKIYQNTIKEEIIGEDLAGNQEMISLEFVPITVEVIQNEQITQSRNLNQNDGEIKLNIFGTKQLQITYTIEEEGIVNSYFNQTVLNQDGCYHFYITDGDYETVLELFISSMGTSD